MAAPLTPPLTAQGPAIELRAGGNSIGYGGPTLPVEEALGNAADNVTAIWEFDASEQRWRLWSPALPPSLRAFDELVSGRAYWVVSAGAVAWESPAGAVPTATSALVLRQGITHIA